MRKHVFFAAVLVFLVAATASAMWSGSRDYYSDAAMTNLTGYEQLNCNGTTNWQWGTTSTYRRMDAINCHTFNDVVRCERWTGTGWVLMTCPW
jgi:hypothetical protein